ncbi:MAG: hypothetical protein NT154_42895, partial [Verrucomicrobia bacterium]|nr:hypothetical protein [Verrucomicrobiota bacterium]
MHNTKYSNIVSAVGCLFLLSSTYVRAAGCKAITNEPACTARHEAEMTALNGKLFLLGGRVVLGVVDYVRESM